MDARVKGEYAEEAFQESLYHWFGTVNPFLRRPRISVDHPEENGVDFRITIESSRSHRTAVRIAWQVKYRSIRTHQCRLYGRRCYRVAISPSQVKRALDVGDPVYLVLGVLRVAPEVILSTPPIRRFDWYAVDLKQFYSRYTQGNGKQTVISSVCIPACNTVNAATASLIWGSWWTRAATQAVGAPELALDFQFRGMMRSVEELCQSHGHLLGDALSRARETYQRARKNFPIELAQDLNWLFGTPLLGGAYRRVMEREEAAGAYRIYSSEGGREEVNSWLFSRWNDLYLRTTSSVQVKKGGDLYMRVLPVLGTPDVPAHLRIAHLHAQRLHRLYGIECRFDVKRDSDDLARVEDISLFENHSSFKNEFLEANGVVRRSKGDLGEHTDFFHDLRERVTRTDYIADVRSHLTRGFEPADLALSGVTPLDLLAPAAGLLSHPLEVWN